MVKKADEGLENVELTCGLVMPISAMEGCSAEHWVEVKNIICDAVGGVEGYNFVSKLVSEQDDVGVIQKRIVQNIYTSDVVVCDVSCKNANVMFELGMRLAFDKPTILIKDDKTDFSFDTGVIEHLVYPRDLRFSRIVTFKKALADKVAATYQAAKNDPNHSTFLKNFGSFKVASVDQTVGTTDQVMLEMMQDLAREVGRIGRRVAAREPLSSSFLGSEEHLTGIREILGAVRKYKETNPSATVESCIGNELFYNYIGDNLATPGRFKTYSSLVAAVDEFVMNNPRFLA